jgi:hypothetical protein
LGEFFASDLLIDPAACAALEAIAESPAPLALLTSNI